MKIKVETHITIETEINGPDTKLFFDAKRLAKQILEEGLIANTTSVRIEKGRRNKGLTLLTSVNKSQRFTKEPT